jgi:uncharacterized protein (TIGR03435 family)
MAAMHMFVETVFWFHPLAWWIGRRMVQERERACDEEVLRLGCEPRAYAEGILNVCAFCVSSPLACVSGVSGSDLKRRIEAIMTHRAALDLDTRRRVWLIAAGAVALIAPIAVGVMGALPGRGQNQADATSPAFEAASVKPHPDTGDRSRTRSIEPGRITVTDVTLRELILRAYDIKPYQISGPDWIQDNTYDVVATSGKAVSAEETRKMLGRLLAERFHLVFHRETRELPVFALVVAKGGPKFKERGDGGERTATPDDMGGLSFKNVSMEEFANWLSLPSMGRPVIDRTGLTGSFSFHANLFNLEKGANVKSAMVSDEATDTLLATLPPELGLDLKPQKAPIEFLVIDHAEKVPTAN